MGWIERFLRFHRDAAGVWVHSRDMTAEHVESFLTNLAVRRKVAASTQNRVLNALVFLFLDVIRRHRQFGAVRAKRPIRLPTVSCCRKTKHGGFSRPLIQSACAREQGVPR